jgi:hypothetical protein
MRGLAMLLVLLVGCDRPTSVVTSAESSEPAEVALRGEITSIAPLSPNRTTHLAADRVGNVFFVQESSGGQDVLFVCGRSGVPRATLLTSSSILDAMGLPRSGRGTIQSIACDRDGSVLFYFRGGHARKSAVCLGRFFPQDEKIQILCETKPLSDATGMGGSIEVATGTVLCWESVTWLWVRHSDAFALFQFTTADVPNSGQMKLPPPSTAVLIRGGTLPLTRDDYDLAAAADKSLVLLDRYLGLLWKIDPSGSATPMQTLLDLPSMVTNPAIHPDGTIALAFSPSEPLEPHGDVNMTPVKLRTSYPALVTVHDGAIRAIGRQDLSAAGSFPIHSMQLSRLCYDMGNDCWVAYDQGSGELLRLRLSRK